MNPEELLTAHVPKLPNGHLAVLVSTPVRGNSVFTHYVAGMLHSNGLHGGWAPMTGQSDIYVARNVIVNEFLKQKQFQQLVLIDSDIGFNRMDFLKLLSHKESFVSGLYPDRNMIPQTLVRDDEGKNIPLEALAKDRLTPAYLVPTGFLKIDRSVLEAIVEKKLVPTYGRGNRHQFFNGRILFDDLASEDYSFCDIVRQAGIQAWVDGSIRLNHDGRTFFA